MSISFKTNIKVLQQVFEKAITKLAGNIVRVTEYEHPVLIEGSGYAGIWLECGPHEGLLYGVIDPEVARRNHRVFLQLQDETGNIPAHILTPETDWSWAGVPQVGRGAIQMVVPIAATALEVYELYGDITFLKEAYTACSRWDDWLAAYRNTRGTGLCEAFGLADTGHDNSPRFNAVPKQAYPQDARFVPQAGPAPYLAPDLSANVYGGRRALAQMARSLGERAAADLWEEKAQQTRRALLSWCFDAEDCCFYDYDASGKFVRLVGDVMTRVLGEHIPDQSLFDVIYARYYKDPDAFWTPYPLPSIAVNDQQFVRELPENSWGGAAQALTAMRAPRWMEYYGQYVDLQHMMRQWVNALAAASDFYQQMNPWTGDFIPSAPGYSPAMLIVLDFIARLYGVRQTGTTLEWTCGTFEGMSFSRFTLDTPSGEACLEQHEREAILTLDGRVVATVYGKCRLITDHKGNLHSVIGITPDTVQVEIVVSREQHLRVELASNQIIMAADINSW